jgi:hypothetical protein
MTCPYYASVKFLFMAVPLPDFVNAYDVRHRHRGYPDL